MYIIAAIVIVIAFASIVEIVRVTSKDRPATNAVILLLTQWLLSIILAALIVWEHVRRY